MFSDIILLYDV